MADVPAAKQSAQLKTVSALPDFIVPIDGWNAQMEEQLLKMQAKVKGKHKNEVNAIVSKMILINATADHFQLNQARSDN